MRIYLTGFMGAGKTTIGRTLAQKLQYPFYDLDQDIEAISRKSIDQIFSQEGEPEFRRLEKKQLEELQQDKAVIATGGGCFIHNREWMMGHGTVIYLNVPFETLAARIGADSNRPLWKNARKLYEERSGEYAHAHFTINAEAEPDEVASRIMEKLKGKT
jgi:shikimate kinase